LAEDGLRTGNKLGASCFVMLHSFVVKSATHSLSIVPHGMPSSSSNIEDYSSRENNGANDASDDLCSGDPAI